MYFLDLTLGSPGAELACDEVLLEACASGGPEVLRFWEPGRPFVVVGYSNRRCEGVRLDACRRRGIPVLRRHSGGGTVVQAPGCLNFALLLRQSQAGVLSGIRATNRWVMERNREALSGLLEGRMDVLGHTDLAIAGRKFSGNAQYRTRGGILFHGTLLAGMDVDLVEELLEIPSVAPDYRRGRSHRDFMANLEVGREALKAALASAWGATDDYPRTAVQSLRADAEALARSDRRLSAGMDAVG